MKNKYITTEVDTFFGELPKHPLAYHGWNAQHRSGGFIGRANDPDLKNLFFLSFNEYGLSTYYVPGIVSDSNDNLLGGFKQSVTETVLHFRGLIFNLVWKINSKGIETRRLEVKTQMMTVIVGIEMERITSVYVQEAKATGLRSYLVVENKGEEGVKDDRQVSVLGD